MRHSIRRYIWLVFVTIIISAQQVFPRQSGEYAKQIKIYENFVKKQMEIDGIPGLSVAFMKDGFIWARGFGYADLANKTPATEKSAYRLASVSKSMTAVAILQLMEKGKIDLDAEVQTYVPYFPRKKWPVTVRQLLGHLGGISHYKDEDVELHFKEHKNTKESLAIFADFDLVAEPGTRFNYSSYGYNLLGAVIEGAADQSYGDYLRQNLWEPLGMHATCMDDPIEIIPNRVRGYRLVDGQLKNSEYIDISSRFGAGATRSTVVDLLKYAKGFLSEKVLSRETKKMMFASMATKEGRLTDYAMGWAVSPVNGHFRFSHGGAQSETRTHLDVFPEENFAVAVAINFEQWDQYKYTDRIAQLILDEPRNMGVYTGNKLDNELLRGIWRVWNYGLSYFDKNKMANSTGQDDLVEAFTYFNNCVNRDSLVANYDATTRKIKDGMHPLANEAYVKAGSYMAARLVEEHGSQGAEIYHKMGAITFFNDYLELCRQEADYPKEYRFSEQFETMIARWNKDWQKTCNEYTRNLYITNDSDLDEIGKKLKKTFADAKIYPEFVGGFAGVTQHFYLEGEREKALEAASLAVELFPKEVTPNVFLANTYVCLGETDKARKYYKKGMEIDPDDWAISAWSLNRHAGTLTDCGKLNEAMALLKIAVELYPQKALLYKGIADVHLERGKNYYRKALELDSNYGPAKNMLKKIQ